MTTCHSCNGVNCKQHYLFVMFTSFNKINLVHSKFFFTFADTFQFIINIIMKLDYLFLLRAVLSLRSRYSSYIGTCILRSILADMHSFVVVLPSPSGCSYASSLQDAIKNLDFSCTLDVDGAPPYGEDVFFYYSFRHFVPLVYLRFKFHS